VFRRNTGGPVTKRIEEELGSPPIQAPRFMLLVSCSSFHAPRFNSSSIARAISKPAQYLNPRNI
jgi:hypothetical protein